MVSSTQAKRGRGGGLGARGAGGKIPGGATLYFEMNLMAVK